MLIISMFVLVNHMFVLGFFGFVFCFRCVCSMANTCLASSICIGVERWGAVNGVRCDRKEVPVRVCVCVNHLCTIRRWIGFVLKWII